MALCGSGGDCFIDRIMITYAQLSNESLQLTERASVPRSSRMTRPAPQLNSGVRWPYLSLQ